VALLLGFSVLAGGCGRRTDQQKVVDKVNAICNDFRRDTKPLFGDVKSLDDFAAQARKAIPAIDRAGRKLATLKAPEDVRKDLGDDYTAFVATFQQEAVAVGAAIGAAEGANRRQFDQIATEFDRLDKRSDRQATKLGFDDCAKG
jgi:ABC-type transporter Mla subunit MlaD